MGDLVNALTMSGETGKGDTSPCVAVPGSLSVRRLTPEECESLQGFPRGYTAIPWKRKPAEGCPDGPRYRALGNSMAVNVMRWIGERIAAAVANVSEGSEP
jgi:DNA (cytosine-5)-methyltransferase 1